VGLDLLESMHPVVEHLPGEMLGHLSGSDLAELIRLLELAREKSRAILESEA
jgi:hypothetical protein